MIGQTISHYAILEKLGEGGMGVVYKAQDLKLDRFVALKFLPPRISRSEQEQSRFMQEAKSASALNHPNVCTIYGIDEFDGQQFIEMELIEGVTLREKTSASQLTIKQVIEYGVQIAEALQEAHSKGIVHRDIKSENIMVTTRGQVKVMDFGLAKLKGSLKLTKTSSTIGTLAYMAPEQIQGVEADTRSDVFSFGVVLFEMTTGKTPFRGEHEAAMMYSIVNEEPEEATTYRPETPAELLHIIRKSLEKDPEDRYQSMSEIVVDLRRLKKESTRVVRTPLFQATAQNESAAIAPLPVTTKEIPRRHLARTIIIGAGALILLLAIVFLSRDSLFSKLERGSDKKIIAVIPFENLGPADKEYFVDGMTDEITSRLSGLSGLSVIARSSAAQYRKTTKSLKQIGGELGVIYILQGTVRWEESEGETHVRVNPTLIKVDDGTQTWSGSMESVLSSAFKLQSDIAGRVANALDVALAKTEKASLETTLTESSEAYDYYLQAIQYGNRSVSRSDFEIAIRLFERAIHADPAFAAAYAKLSIVHSNMYWFFYDRTADRIEKARAAAERATALAPELSEAHEAMGWYYYHTKLDYKNSLDEFSLALKYRPNNSDVNYGIAAVLRRQGDMAGSIESFKKAIMGNPRAADLVRQLGETQMLLRDYEEADRSFMNSLELAPDVSAVYWERAKNGILWKGDLVMARRLMEDCSREAKDNGSEYYLADMMYEIDVLGGEYEAAKKTLDHEPAYLVVHDQFEFIPKPLLRAQLEQLMGNRAEATTWYDSARVFLERQAREHPEDERVASSLGKAYAGLGRKDDAIREGKRGLALLPVEREAWRGSARLTDLAMIYATTGEQDAAVDALRRLLSIPCELSPTMIKLDPRWTPLRENKRFQEVINASL
ncbi:MAG TPA: protein kinase [Bacteroidota bacterium]|nr:protein kinase [Bacteroidota bacterium]